MKKLKFPEIQGNLEIFSVHKDEQKNIYIHGDTDGLLSFAELLKAIATTNQEELKEIPVGAKIHIHLDPDIQLSISSDCTVVGRLDAKGTGEFHSSFIPRGTKQGKT